MHFFKKKNFIPVLNLNLNLECLCCMVQVKKSRLLSCSSQQKITADQNDPQCLPRVCKGTVRRILLLVQNSCANPSVEQIWKLMPEMGTKVSRQGAGEEGEKRAVTLNTFSSPYPCFFKKKTNTSGLLGS